MNERPSTVTLDESAFRLAERVGQALVEASWTVGVAESCTGGLVAKLLTDVPGSSRYVSGGVVAYSNESKIRLLGVDEASIERWGAVSEEVAAEMAAGAVGALGVDLGIGVTGVAGPDGGSEEKPIGTVCFGVATSVWADTRRLRFQGDRPGVRSAAARYALELIEEVVKQSG